MQSACIRTSERCISANLDKEVYKWRHLIEKLFCKLKEFKRIAMRSDKTDQSFAALIYFTNAVIHAQCPSINPSLSDITLTESHP